MGDKLTQSPRLNKLLYQMGIFNHYDVVNHLPRRYEDFSYTHEKDLSDKERVVLIGKIVSLPKVNKTSRVEVTTFDFITRKKTYFRVVAFNRPYLSKNVNLEDEFTLVGSFNKKRNEIDMLNIFKGEIPLNERIKPIYSLPMDYQNHLFSSLVRKSLNEVDGHIFTLVPYEFLNKYRLIGLRVSDSKSKISLASAMS